MKTLNRYDWSISALVGTISLLLLTACEGLNNPNRPVPPAKELGFQDFAPSGILRNRGVSQLTLAEERTFSIMPNGYPPLPSLALHDENDPNVVTRHTPSVRVCGTTQSTIADRIADCAEEWDGQEKAVGPAGKWKLVTRTSGLREVWQDMRTGLLWSDQVGSATTGWCQASGSDEDFSAFIVTPIDCGDTTYDGDWCADADKQEDRGNLTSGVNWRLPTVYDWMQAEIDGVRYVLPRIAGQEYWSSTIFSIPALFTVNVRSFSGASEAPSLSNIVINDLSKSVRCVGRPEEL